VVFFEETSMKKVLILAMALVAVFARANDDDGMAASREALLGGPAKAAPAVALRDTRITADHMEYNYKESVAILTDNVKVDDVRFKLTADQLFVFLESTNTLERLVVRGNVKVENDDRRASCDKAVYIKAEERLVMAGNAKLQSLDANGKARTVAGDKITIWTKKGDQRMEVYPNPELIIPAGSTEGIKDMM
jgi:lipopolysaccharide transport protein LptA